MKFHWASSPPLSLVYLQMILFLLMKLQSVQANSFGNETDLLALLKFKEGITSDPHGILNSWNDSLHFCNWFGITCSHKHQRVTSLVLQVKNLFGVISPYIGNLSFLRDIDLQNNNFCGEIPQDVGNLFRLQQFVLHNNSLEGEIPTNLTHCSQLKEIDLSKNSIVGNIPAELGSLPKLEVLQLSKNNLTGKIPPYLGNLSSLTFFSATYNNFVGQIPDDMGRLTSLTNFYSGTNKLSGIVPPSIFNISSINAISLTDNQLDGSLPESIGLTLPNLRIFAISMNKFSGSIPTSLSNASQLQMLDVGRNKFAGQVPTNLGGLQSLLRLQLSRNNLGRNSANDMVFLTSLKNCSGLKFLAFSYNHFGGVLPMSIANLSIQLRSLYLGGNQFTGIIPQGLVHFVNLTVLSMEDNLFTGVIPPYFGKFQKLQGLDLSGNRLSGQIPYSIGNLTQLFALDLQQNNFEGSIPSSIGNCQHLYYLAISQNNLSATIPQDIMGISSLSALLNLSKNSLTGNLPAEVGKLAAINQLDVSENSLSGEIPSTIGDCLSLEYLHMQGNSFRGTIPSSLASLKGLQKLDLSRNNLTGEIPRELQNILYLEYLNLSFNDLEGEVPSKGVFKNASAISLIGNSKLCGGVPELYLPRCPTRAAKKGKSFALKLTIILICAFLCILLILSFLAISWKRKPKKKSSFATVTTGSLINVSYKGLYQATGGFSPSNLIGSGSFGSVYRGLLEQVERPVAVKVLDPQKQGASKTFAAECKALRNIRHRNLVKILTYCSSLDYKGNEFKALVFEFMENGSLEKWLHTNIDSQNSSRRLNLLQRLNIAVDVASALHYLHDLCERPIIHCDLKPSNILLDNDMIAHLGDFGLARFLLPANDVSDSQTSTIGIKGTIGYAAPEYGMGGEASKEGDVYSYGILLLEMFSGRRPTDDIFNDGLNLHDFVKAALSERIAQVVDPAFLPRDFVEPTLLQTDIERGEATEQNNDYEIVEEDKTNNQRPMEANVKKCLLLILQIGVACSAELPRDRMNMGDVIRELDSVKKALLGTHRGRQHTTQL